MANEKDTRQRFKVGPFYTSEVTEKAVNELLADFYDGNSKSKEILSALRFKNEWQEKVADFDGGNVEELEDLRRKLRESEKRIQELQADMDNAAKNLEEHDQVLSVEHENAIKALEKERDDWKDHLDAAVVANTGLETEKRALEIELEKVKAGKPTWSQVKQLMDPLYAAMCEEMAERLSTEENRVDPLMAPLDIFFRYHVLRFVELPFQPLIPKARLSEMVREQYPEVNGIDALVKLMKLR